MTFIKTIAALLLSATAALAQHAHSNHGGTDVIETGQAQFASIAEIVSVLRTDPSTNWEMVNIAALQAHLVDMDNVMTRSRVVVENGETTVTFRITGNNEVAQSIQRMVTAHSPMLAAETGWTVTSALIAQGARLTVIVAEDAERHQVIGLGFYGMMTIGAHHKEHHLMIASGGSPH